MNIYIYIYIYDSSSLRVKSTYAVFIVTLTTFHLLLCTQAKLRPPDDYENQMPTNQPA